MLNLNLPERFELSGPSHDWFVEDDPSDDFCAGRSGQGPGVMVEALKVDALHKRHQIEVSHVYLVSALEAKNILSSKSNDPLLVFVCLTSNFC